MKRFLALLAALSLMLVPVSTAFADGDPPIVPPDGSVEITIQDVVTNQNQVTTQVFVNKGRPGGIAPNASASVQIGSWSIEWANAVAYGIGGGNKYVRHEFARTRKTAGTGSYKAHSHATLIKGNSYSNPTVFDYITYPCAWQDAVNATALTCSSPWQLSSTGQKWYIISGHEFDIGNNGSVDASCPGCIDWIYTTP